MTDRTPLGTTGRRPLLKAIGAGAIGATVASASSGLAAATNHADAHYENPLSGPDFADPTIHRADDGTWWAYASNMSYSNDADEELVPILSSPDLVDWTDEGRAFESRPGWAYGSIWAPDVHYHDGQWVLFYSLWPREDDQGDQTGIGVATADAPDGPFTDHGKLFTNPEHPYPGNTIDPYFVAYQGTPYLFWGNFAGVYYVELTADLLEYRSGTFGQIVGSAYEGSAIFEREGYWYFFGATGDCCDGYDSTYEVEVGRAEDLLGPYSDRDGTPMMERDEWNAGPTHLGDDERFVGPGHGDVTVADDGTYWFLYHAYDRQGPEMLDNGWPPARQLFMDRIYWHDGWPIIGGDETPSASAPVPNLGQRPAPVADGTYGVESADGRVLAVDGTEDGASAIVSESVDGSRAEWQVSRLSGGEYLLENVASGQALEVANADTSEGADVRQWPWHRHPTQRWYLHESDDGAVHLENACSNGVAGLADGTNVVQQSWNDGPDQRWSFDLVDDGGELPPIGGGNPPQDPDDDGLYEDVNGNGRTDSDDVVQFFGHVEDDAVQQHAEHFDFNESGSVGFDDVVALFRLI